MRSHLSYLVCALCVFALSMPGQARAEEPYEGAGTSMTRVALGAGLLVAGGSSMVLGYRHGKQSQQRAGADEIDQLTAHRHAGQADILLFGGALATIMGTSLVVYEFSKKSDASLSHTTTNRVRRVWFTPNLQGIQLNVSFR